MSEYNNTYTLCAQPKHYSTINNYVLINALKKVSLVLNSSYFIPSFLLRGKYYLEFLSIIVLFFFVVWAHLCIFMQYTALFFKTCFWTLQKWITWFVLGFSVGMEAFDELLSINVPWSQEFSGVLRIWT